MKDEEYKPQILIGKGDQNLFIDFDADVLSLLFAQTAWLSLTASHPLLCARIEARRLLQLRLL